MRIARRAAAPSEPASDHFDGDVSRRDYGTLAAPDGTALLVRFDAGSRTHWHSHAAGQVLYVVDGHGRVGTRDGRVEAIGTGDLVVAPPDEEHWHGAAIDRPVEHLALSFGVTRWFEPVED